MSDNLPAVFADARVLMQSPPSDTVMQKLEMGTKDGLTEKEHHKLEIARKFFSETLSALTWNHYGEKLASLHLDESETRELARVIAQKPSVRLTAFLWSWKGVTIEVGAALPFGAIVVSPLGSGALGIAALFPLILFLFFGFLTFLFCTPALFSELPTSVQFLQSFNTIKKLEKKRFPRAAAIQSVTEAPKRALLQHAEEASDGHGE